MGSCLCKKKRKAAATGEASVNNSSSDSLGYDSAPRLMGAAASPTQAPAGKAAKQTSPKARPAATLPPPADMPELRRSVSSITREALDVEEADPAEKSIDPTLRAPDPVRAQGEEEHRKELKRAVEDLVPKERKRGDAKKGSKRGGSGSKKAKRGSSRSSTSRSGTGSQRSRKESNSSSLSHAELLASAHERSSTFAPPSASAPRKGRSRRSSSTELLRTKVKNKAASKAKKRKLTLHPSNLGTRSQSKSSPP